MPINSYIYNSINIIINIIITWKQMKIMWFFWKSEEFPFTSSRCYRTRTVVTHARYTHVHFTCYTAWPDNKTRVYGAVVYPLVFAENCETRDDSVPEIRAMNFARVRPEIASWRNERKTRDGEVQKESFYQCLFIGATNCAIFWDRQAVRTLANDAQKDAFLLWTIH